MRPYLIIFISLVVLLVAALGLYQIFGPKSGNQNPPATTGTNPFGTPAGTNPGSTGGNTGTGTGTSSGGTATSSGNTLTVTNQNGSKVAVPDFTKESQPAWVGPSAGYQVAGSNSSDFQIIYTPPNNGGWSRFLIDLNTEPLGTTRLNAEEALQSKLNLSRAQMCAMDIEVWVPAGVNISYAGRNLGLSFCPNSTPLP